MRAGREALLWAAAAVGVVLLIAVIWVVRYATADARGAANQREATRADAAYRISAYDRFHDDCAAALTTQQNLESARQQATAPGLDQARQLQLQANVTALANTLNSQVNQYNADAAKADTRAHFLSSDLPYQLTATEEITCSVP